MTGNEELIAWALARPHPVDPFALGYLLMLREGRSPKSSKLVAECERGVEKLRAEMLRERSRAS